VHASSLLSGREDWLRGRLRAPKGETQCQSSHYWILDIELEIVQELIRTAAARNPFRIDVTESAKNFLLTEGTDFRCGARPLKRAIEHLLVQPLSNLMATSQIHHGARIRVTHKDGSLFLVFSREAGAFEASEVADRAAA
jgi:ATP-dependent Clp protease ATP-binding subunit ClpA